jgi:hypothetical protein
MSTLMAIKDEAFFTFGHRAETDLAVEAGSGRTLGLVVGDAFAIRQTVSGFTFYADQTDASSVAPVVAWWTFWVLEADTLLAVEEGSFQTGRDASDTAASNQSRAWSALRGEAGDTIAFSIGNGTRGTNGVASGDASGAIESRIGRADGNVWRDTLLAVEGATLIGTFGNAGVGDAVGAVEGKSILAHGLGDADTDALLKSGSSRALDVNSGNTVLAREQQPRRTFGFFDCGTDGPFQKVARRAFRELRRDTAAAVQLGTGRTFGDLCGLLLTGLADLGKTRGTCALTIGFKYTEFTVPSQFGGTCGGTAAGSARGDIDGKIASGGASGFLVEHTLLREKIHLGSGRTARLLS